MKNLSTYIIEALKKVGEYKDPYYKRNDGDVIQVLDRSFREGELTDTAFKKWIESDIKECFNLSDSKLNKGFDKMIEQLTREGVSKEEALKTCPRHTIERISMQLNPVSGFGAKGVARDAKVKLAGDYVWSSNTVDRLLEWFEGFGVYMNGKWIDMRQYVVGWKITYIAYSKTECPKTGTARLELILTKEGQAIVDRHNKRQDDTISAYYTGQDSGSYAGD